MAVRPETTETEADDAIVVAWDGEEKRWPPTTLKEAERESEAEMSSFRAR
jgi:hypothetical protein